MFDPDYGDTPLPFDELTHLLPEARASLDNPITEAALYDLEQSIQTTVTEDLLTSVVEGSLGLDELLTDIFVRELHTRLYGSVWSWAGTYRRHLLNIGVDPTLVAIELRTSVETIRYRWEHARDWTPRELGIAVHAECVRIHPFADGNGRSTRLLVDLVFAAAQEAETVELYTWQVDKPNYIRLLREYDHHRDPKPLAAFIPTYEI